SVRGRHDPEALKAALLEAHRLRKELSNLVLGGQEHGAVVLDTHDGTGRGQVLSHQGQGAINDADQGSVKPGRNLTGLNSRRGVDGALESVRIGHLEVRLNLSLSERPHNLLVTKVDEPAVQVGRVRPTLSAEHDRLSGDTVARNLRLVTRVRGNGRLARPTETRLAVRRERPLSQERDVLTPVRSRPVNLPEPRRRGGELTQAVAVVVVVVV